MQQQRNLKSHGASAATTINMPLPNLLKFASKIKSYYSKTLIC
jgi:hypothetical protein